MKKILSSLFLCLLIIGGLQSYAFADELDTVDQVFQKAVELELLTLKEGKVEFIGNLEELTFKQQLQNEFQEKIQSINSLSEGGFVKVDSNFEVILATPSEIEEIVYNAGPEFVYDGGTLYGVDNGLPSINLKSLVQTNRAEVEKFYNDVMKISPTSGYTSTVGYFVGKVREGGSWDYKVQPGYRYWYKEWNAYTYSGTKVINTEYIGNYNYAYVGEFLFSKSVLLLGGGAVGVGVGQPEDAKDREAITQGFNDAVKYE